MFLDNDELIPRIDEFLPEVWFNIDAEIRPYLRELRRVVEDVDEEMVPTAARARPAASVVSDNAFVTLYATRPVMKTSRRSGKVVKDADIEDIPVEGLLKRKERLILLTGEAGSGKSTALRRLTFLHTSRTQD